MQSNNLQLHRLIIYIVFILLSINAPTKLANGETTKKTDLTITDKGECASLGGSWNECPPNECQKNPDYKNGKIVCPQVCGSPLCDGIIPATETDLSTIHNPDIDHQVETDAPLITPKNQDAPTSAPLQEDITQTKPLAPIDNNTQQNLSINQKQIILYAALCILLVIFFLLLKVKKRK